MANPAPRDVLIRENGNRGESAHCDSVCVSVNTCRDGRAEASLFRARKPGTMERLVRTEPLDEGAAAWWRLAAEVVGERDRLDELERRLRAKEQEVAQELVRRYQLRAGVMMYA